ncbi:MAG: FCD domain-containing protein [Vicinamibacteraceae bacterium]
MIVAEGRAAVGSSTVSLPALIDLGLRFHTALYDATGNGILSDTMRSQWVNLRRILIRTVTTATYWRHVWQEHAQLLDAIISHDAPRAGALAARHTSAACLRLIEHHRRTTRE